MNSTSGTHSSDNESLKGDMSYLFGRDPSILAYGQRPFPSQESKKNLMNLLEEEEDESVDCSKKTISNTNLSSIQTIQVFLRMKPFPPKMKITKEESEAYTIIDSTTLLTKMRSLDNNTSCLKKIKSNNIVCREFLFTQTFGPEVSQLQLFEQAVQPQMVDFLSGKNSVVMSYGTTNSGKTFTLQGTPECPGIIPRAIEYVFNHITPRALPSYKPVNLSDVICLNEQDRFYEAKIKSKLFTLNPTDKSCSANTYHEMQTVLHKESPMKQNNICNAQYSVWISFAEIYNETIYDLLLTDCQKKRPVLKLATDNKGKIFIKGLKSVCVNSGAEAYQVLMAGQYNLQIAATALNSRSSRSHCIFTIKLLKYRTENNPCSVEVNTFAFCDLAGSERLKKTLNVGERLKEAQCINTSLLVLGRCLKTIHESQCSLNKKNESLVPFRESKLTRLFQRALSGKEQITMIVNINPVPNFYVETQNVLNFSAIAKKIVIERIETVKKRRSHSRFSRLVTKSMKTDMDWENTELEDMTEYSEELENTSDGECYQEAYEELLTENELLKKEIKKLKDSALTRDMQTRQEMTDMYSEIIKKVEADYKNQLIDMEEVYENLKALSIERVKSFYKEKLNQLNASKHSGSSMSDDEDDDEKSLQDIESENTRLITKLEIMKKSIRTLKKTVEDAENEKKKISSELADVKEEAKRANELLLATQKSISSGNDTSGNLINELEDIINMKNERIKTLKSFLNEAKEEYISITDQAQKLDEQLKERNELIAENSEHILDLQEQLSQANAYSAEQNKVIENLEEELDQLNKKLIETNTNDESKLEAANEELRKTKEHLDKIKTELELSENNNKKLEEKLNSQVSIIAENEQYQKLKTENTELLAREQEKDTEISSLQSELKKVIQSNEETVKKMEVEMKITLKALRSKEDELAATEEKYKKQEKELMRVVSILEQKIHALEKEVLEKQGENGKLQFTVEEYTKRLGNVEHEMEVFQRNRNQTVEKYEELVASQRDELERLKKEVVKLQDLLQEVKENAVVLPTPLKGRSKKLQYNVKEEKKKAKNTDTDATDMTSEDDHEEIPRSNRKLKKQYLSPNKDNIPVIELSSSESKKLVKSATKDPPSTIKRNRKKLFTQLDESYVDIDGEPSPCQTRSLRNRRK